MNFDNAYKQALKLYQTGNTDEALEILERMNNARPGTQRVLYTMALCLMEEGEYEAVVDLCDELLTKNAKNAGAAGLREQALIALQEDEDENDLWATLGESTVVAHRSRAPRVKMFLILLMVTLAAAMYFGYFPHWLGGAIIGSAGTSLLFLALLPRIANHFMAEPFRSKGRVLLGAQVEVLHVKDAPPPSHADEDDEIIWRGLNHCFIDLRITPAPTSEGPRHWRPDALMLAAEVRLIDGPADLNACYPVHESWLLTNTPTPGSPDFLNATMCAGPQDVRIHAAIDPEVKTYKLVYFFQPTEAFTVELD